MAAVVWWPEVVAVETVGGCKEFWWCCYDFGSSMNKRTEREKEREGRRRK